MRRKLPQHLASVSALAGLTAPRESRQRDGVNGTSNGPRRRDDFRVKHGCLTLCNAMVRRSRACNPIQGFRDSRKEPGGAPGPERGVRFDAIGDHEGGAPVP